MAVGRTDLYLFPLGKKCDLAVRHDQTTHDIWTFQAMEDAGIVEWCRRTPSPTPPTVARNDAPPRARMLTLLTAMLDFICPSDRAPP